MDPFSISVGIAGLVAVVTQTLSITKDYLSSVKHSRDSVITLVTELEALQFNLSSLDGFLRSDSVRAQALAFQRTSVLWSCTSACESKLKSLCKKLRQVGDSRTSRYLWPLSEKEHKKTVQELQAFSQWMQFALSIDGCSLLSQTSDDVLKIMTQQLEWFKSIQNLEEQTMQLQRAVADQTRLLQNDLNTKTRYDILNWISKLDYDRKHHIIRSNRVQDTGHWLLKRVEYSGWRDGGSGSNILWCHGIQGSGKTVLTSMVIDELKGSVSGSESPVAFFYFDYRDQYHQTPVSLLSSLLKQVIATTLKIPKCVVDAYKKAHDGSEPLPLRELENMIFDIASSMHQIYLIIDALDECDELLHRKAVLLLLSRMNQIPNIRIFVTSRQYPHDIKAAFQVHPQITIHAHESDLRRYMYQEFEHSSANDAIDGDFVSKVVDTLISRAQGMFLLPVLQLRTILKEPTVGEMEDALISLSRDLPEAFEETIARIQRLPESRRRLGVNTLMWICHAKRRLTVFELSEALSVRFGQKIMSQKHCPSPNMIIECCQGLVTLDSESGSIYLAHYAIQEYLIVHSEKLFPKAESQIATTCLVYLLFEAFKEGPCSEEIEIRARIEKNPFVSYASRYWGVHAQNSETEENVQQFVFAFLASHDAIARSYQIMELEKLRWQDYWTLEECYSVTALHHASYFGLENTVQSLLNQGTLHIDARTEMGTTPIIKAACASPAGHPSIVKMLLQRGANPYLGNWYGNALHCAAEAGCSTTIRQLIEYGMSPNDTEHYDRLPINCTLDNDKSNAFETLVELGADMNIGGEGYFFHTAISNGCFNIVDLILRRNWAQLGTNNECGISAMHLAARSCNLAIISRILEAGGNINILDSNGNTPLDHIDQEVDGDVAAYMLSRGAVTGAATVSFDGKDLDTCSCELSE